MPVHAYIHAFLYVCWYMHIYIYEQNTMLHESEKGEGFVSEERASGTEREREEARETKRKRERARASERERLRECVRDREW